MRLEQRFPPIQRLEITGFSRRTDQGTLPFVTAPNELVVLDRRLSRIDIVSALYPSNRAQFHSLPRSDRKQVADSIAAALRELYAAEFIGDDFVRASLAYCRDAVLHMGWDEPVLGMYLAEARRSPNRRLVIVPGCQTPNVLFSRVRRAAQIIKEIPDEWTLVASGIHAAQPPHNQLKVLREYARIDGMLQECLSTADYERVNRLNDPESTTTRQNVRSLFDFIRSSTEMWDITVSSSNFHLPAISQLLKEELTTTPELQAQVGMIALAGGEAVTVQSPLEPLIVTDEYLKQLFFAMVSYLLSSDHYRAREGADSPSAQFSA